MQRLEEIWVARSPEEKRQLLGFLASNFSWKDDQLVGELRQPFAGLRDMNEEFVQRNALGDGSEGEYVVWYPERRDPQTLLATSSWRVGDLMAGLVG